jgi:hypothetical protein
MSSSEWYEALATAQTSGAAYASSVTPTSILPTAAKKILFDGFFKQPGKKIEIRAGGQISNIVTTPGTLTLEVRFGAIVAFSSGAIPLNIVAKTNVTWEYTAKLTCFAVGGGTGANMMGFGRFTSESVLSSPAGLANTCMLPASAPAVGAGFDSSAAQAVDLFATWSVNNSGNSIQLMDYTLIALN